MNTNKLTQKILANINIDPVTGCWNWSRAIRSDGYGTLAIDNKQYAASRASYMVFKGEVGDGLVVCHTCDNKKCVNPAHLYAGSLSDNIRDSYERTNRTKTGSVPDNEVREIRARYRHGNGRALAKEYGIHHKTVLSIAHGESYKYVT